MVAAPSSAPSTGATLGAIVVSTVMSSSRCPGVIDGLQAVHQRPVLDRDGAPGHVQSRVGHGEPRLQRQHQDHYVAVVPLLVTEPEHPYVSAWCQPGHGLGYEHGFTHQVVDLVAAIAENRQPTLSFDDGLLVQRVLSAVEDSAARDPAWTTV